ncbi:MAG TPA: STAS domain-containing protein [Candidatus Baltobacteraceae bacterium]|jgi:anti-anti-sigma factor|nr:STAS domain-containing protein [Candidatus Baltobacteraceae bacterium]
MQTTRFSYSDAAAGAIERLEWMLAASAQQGRRLILDLDQLPVLDNAAIRGLIRMLRRVREAGGTLALSVTRPEHRSVLQITALDRIFEVAAC